MPYKDPEVKKAYARALYLKYHDFYKKVKRENIERWRLENPEVSRKCKRISDWKHMGIICEDWNELYDYYIMSWNCEYCWCPLVEGCKASNKRCLDHDHDTGEVRGILCNTCNHKSKDVFNSKINIYVIK